MLAGGERILFLAGLLADDRILEPLHAVGAFFHHPAHAHRDVGVALEMGRLADLLLAERALVEVVGNERVALVIIEEIEAAHLVRAVVRAIARADAAVVGHRVEAVLGMHGGVDRANRFAGSQLALEAGDGLRHQCGIVRVEIVVLLGGEVAIHTDPMHFAALGDLFLADDGNVVLCLAGYEAGVAAHAGG